jgi:hypothetical protein
LPCWSSGVRLPEIGCPTTRLSGPCVMDGLHPLWPGRGRRAAPTGDRIRIRLPAGVRERHYLWRVVPRAWNDFSPSPLANAPVPHCMTWHGQLASLAKRGLFRPKCWPRQSSPAPHDHRASPYLIFDVKWVDCQAFELTGRLVHLLAVASNHAPKGGEGPLGAPSVNLHGASSFQAARRFPLSRDRIHSALAQAAQDHARPAGQVR